MENRISYFHSVSNSASKANVSEQSNDDGWPGLGKEGRVNILNMFHN